MVPDNCRIDCTLQTLHKEEVKTLLGKLQGQEGCGRLGI